MLRISRSENNFSTFSAWKIIGIEQDKKAINYKSLKSKLVTRDSKLVFVFGNEVDGLSKQDLKLCDAVAEVPMRGAMVRQAHHPRNSMRGKESLNVAVAVGIVLYALR
jgi:tRNA G18 (ribose-2'-O)-methylase SpoU